LPSSTEMDVAQSSKLNSDIAGNTDGYGAKRAQGLRGDAQNDGGPGGTCTPSFRSRPTSKLGDLIHSAPSYVAMRNFGYPDSFEAAAYSAFAVANANRAPTIY